MVKREILSASTEKAPQVAAVKPDRAERVGVPWAGRRRTASLISAQRHGGKRKSAKQTKTMAGMRKARKAG
eukprot:scaffold3550_cov112-Isochrysis_galbana.AAC.11